MGSAILVWPGVEGLKVIIRDAKNGGYDDVAQFFEQVMEEDSRRAARCHEFLQKLSS